MRKFVIFLLATLFVNVANATTIDVRIAIEGGFHPWNFCIDNSNQVTESCTDADIANGFQLSGFDHEYGEVLCDMMSQLDEFNDYNCIWVLKPWTDLAQGTGAGLDYDMAITQITDLPSRRGFFNFVGPYMELPEVKFIVGINDNIAMGPATRTPPRYDILNRVMLDCPVDTNLLY